MAKSWPDDRIKEARALWDSGVSARKIGEHFGCSRNAILGLAHRNAWPHRKKGVSLVTLKTQRSYGRDRELFDPRRADKLLRRFSWQEAAE